MAPPEWQPVTGAPTPFHSLSVFFCVFRSFFFTTLIHSPSTRDVQLVRVVICLLLTFGLFKTTLGDPFSHGSFVYTRDQLLALCHTRVLPSERLQIPEELRRRRRGCRAGAKRRERKRRYKPAILSVIMGNVRSLPNKMEELT